MSLNPDRYPLTTVEIVERRTTPSPGAVAPNEVRINGSPVTVAVDSIAVNPGNYSEPATVTLTLIVDSLSVHSEQSISPSRARYLDRLRATHGATQ